MAEDDEEKHRALSRRIGKYDLALTPHYSRVVRKITRENISLLHRVALEPHHPMGVVQCAQIELKSSIQNEAGATSCDLCRM